MVERRPPKPEVEGSSPSSPAIINRGCNMITSLRRYFKSISVETGKVSWMTRPQILNSTFIVGVFALIITLFLFVLDNGLSYLVKILFQGDVG